MNCTCPKCHAKIEMDLPEVTEAGTSATCPACNAHFSVYRESFGGRALRKTGEISCAPCGNELGAQTHCPSCGAQFPDYLVVSLGRKRARKADTKVKLKGSPFPKAGKASSAPVNVLPSLGSLQPEAQAKPALAAAPGRSKLMAIAVSVLVVVALVGAGTFFYLKNKAEKTYLRNFVLATYCVQLGADKSLKANEKIAAEWKAKSDAAQAYRPRASLEDEKDLDIIKTKLDGVMPNLSQPPEKFAQCNERLAKLQGAYNKLRAQTLAPGNTLAGFLDSSAKLDGEYKQAVKSFKSGMPEDIMNELQVAGKRYKGLRPLLNM